MTVGEKIQQRRKEKGWSQEDLAEQVGVSRQSISLWEKDQTTPSLENMKTLCRLFQISMDELLGQTPLPSPTQPPPPPAMVTTHWSPAFLKRALGMLHCKYLAVTLGFAVTLMVLGILFAVLGWAAGEDYGANLAGFLFYSLIFLGVLAAAPDSNSAGCQAAHRFVSKPCHHPGILPRIYSHSKSQ